MGNISVKLSFDCKVIFKNYNIFSILICVESLVWTGIKKGPPRKLKFPVNDELIEEIKKII